MNIAVIFAGGIGQRMNTRTLPKQFLNIHSKPIIIHTLGHFERNDKIDAIVIACVEEWIVYLKKILGDYNIKKVKKIVPGGETGQLSIYNGLLAAEEIVLNESINNQKNVVLIHDGVRPLINQKLIDDCINSVEKYGSAITSVPVKETVLMVSDEKTNDIEYITDRSKTRLARAPQCFLLDEILKAQRHSIEKGRTNYVDSCSLMQDYGAKMHLIDGPIENIKVTTPDDFFAMRAYLDSRENAQIYFE